MLYSSNNKNPQYQARAKLYHDKLKSELHRKGRFIPVFPRKMTWYMYRYRWHRFHEQFPNKTLNLSFILEDVGDEKWDEDLHNRLIESEICNSSDLPHVTMEDIRNAHHQMINAKMVGCLKESKLIYIHCSTRQRQI
jgi:hypothetical protein